MKTLLFLLLMALPASAQQYFRDGTSHFLDIDTTARSTTTSTGAQTLWLRLTTNDTPTSGIYYAIAASGSVQQARVAAVDQATASFMPPNSTRIVKVSPGVVVVAVGVTESGILTVTELSQ